MVYGTLRVGFKMSSRRAHVILPADLLAEIDTLVGQRGRSAFLVDVLQEEVRRRRLLQLLNSTEPIWKSEDHPELAEGAESWVRKMRNEDLRLERKKADNRVSRSRRKGLPLTLQIRTFS